MKFMTKYIIIWVCVAIMGISTIFILNAQKANITCVDGTFVTDKAQCPQCTQNSHCGPDKVCQDNSCFAKRCLTDEDCDTAQSACIFEKCTKSTGKI